MRTHLTEQNKVYGNQSLVNLVNQKGHEKPVKEAYERYVAEVCMLLMLYYMLLIHVLAGPTWSQVSIFRLPSRVQKDALGSYQYSY